VFPISGPSQPTWRSRLSRSAAGEGERGVFGGLQHNQIGCPLRQNVCVTVRAYPLWDYFPRNAKPPAWVDPFVSNVESAEADISTVHRRTGLDSDGVLYHLTPGLRDLGYAVESGKKAAERIRRPVLFGRNGRAEVSYEIDAFHDGYGIVVEVEAARGARGNATYRDIIRASLIVDAQFLALLLPVAYRHTSGGREVTVRAHEECLALLSALYASQRLALPFHGVLLVGY
jgi:hypothetical protein